ncbi:M23 family metallopeptidase [Streptomyces sp. XM4193]|uniref:M23 family metallopeptidase n=1 Tax=Streptomyces sp. XM4193 TaxID=2929782 RepID=UPI001FF8E96B|nr:M23 family metallopeptidase [Streptomyces sp. XM4193]MCK1796783.1 M23 family metallopeptidase [Streptomyces sp. XM4193]
MWWKALRRRQGLVFLAAVVCIAVPTTLGHGISPVYMAGIALLVLWFVLRVPSRVRDARPVGEGGGVLVAPPMAGRWSALNGPAEKVPSHGTHDLGQTYAIDVLHEPDGLPEDRKRRFHLLWPPTRTPAHYASFGQPLFAPADGVVVRADDRQRDHLGRMSTLGLLYLLPEGLVRSMGGYRFVLGNHVIVRLDVHRTGPQQRTGGHPGAADAGEKTTESADGGVEGGEVYAVLAHLRRGSLTVAVGDRVAEGQQLGQCGNSGNSSDPHLHFHLMDGEEPTTARGVPFNWCYRDEDGTERVGVPRNGPAFRVTTAQPGTATPPPGARP